MSGSWYLGLPGELDVIGDVKVDGEVKGGVDAIIVHRVEALEDDNLTRGKQAHGSEIENMRSKTYGHDATRSAAVTRADTKLLLLRAAVGSWRRHPRSVASSGGVTRVAKVVASTGGVAKALVG